MMVPFARHGQLTPQQQNFNMRLSQARVRVENSYALAKGKWRRLKYFCVRNEQNVVDHIMASFVLHNMLIFYGEHLLDVSSMLYSFCQCMSCYKPPQSHFSCSLRSFVDQYIGTRFLKDKKMRKWMWLTT